MYWVKNRIGTGERVVFYVGIPEDKFLQKLGQASNRERIRKEQYTAGETLVTTNFSVKLKNNGRGGMKSQSQP